MRILIIDDDPVQLDLLQRMLRSRERELLTASSASMALMATHVGAPDLLLIDLYLSGPDGLELRERMRAMGAIGDAPFVIMSASDSDLDRGRALAAGAEAYLVKPIEARGIRAVVRKIEERLTSAAAGGRGRADSSSGMSAR